MTAIGVFLFFGALMASLAGFHCHQQLHMDCGFMTLFDYLGMVRNGLWF
jgi:hypothetical protein